MPRERKPHNSFAAKFAAENPAENILLGEEVLDEAREIKARLMGDIRKKGGDFGIAAETEWVVHGLPKINSTAEYKEVMAILLGVATGIYKNEKNMAKMVGEVGKLTADFNAEDWFLFHLHFI